MNYRIVIVYFACLILGLQHVYSQKITGTIYGYEDKVKKSPLPGVNIYWVNTTQGTLSDNNGAFSLSSKGIKDPRLVLSFMGYVKDTVLVSNEEALTLILIPDNKQLGEVTISGFSNSSYISRINARNVQVVTQGELFRAACCNLAESFETNASVDVMYSDAITGAKQIQLLGLSGVYSQIVTENVPLVRGLGTAFGLNYVPGSWMESIYVSKGTSSVLNGFESITGQINVEYKKPATSEKLFVNLYGNDRQRMEGNLNTRLVLNDRLSTMIMLHGSSFRKPFDENGDKFMDMPEMQTINVFNRWDYDIPNRFDSRFGIKYLDEKRNGGFMDFNKQDFNFTDTTGITNLSKSYGIELNTRRMEVFWKNGVMFPSNPERSIGTIISAIIHDQDGFFGMNRYEGKERSYFANFLYATPLSGKAHKVTMGMSLQANRIEEAYHRQDFLYRYQTTGSLDDLWILDSTWKTHYPDKRDEVIPGTFIEYTYKPHDLFSLILGIRADHQEHYGVFFTPRAHMRYQLNDHLTMKASAGKGYRTMNVFPENYSVMASQRKLRFIEAEKNPGAWNFGLTQEEAWNYGLNLGYDFTLFTRKATLDVDFYRTDFVNQVVVDMDSDPASVFFYNLEGKSYSNVGQVQLTMEPATGLSLLMAFRMNDVKTSINDTLRVRPFVNMFKGLITAGYATRWDKWKFDVTAQINGKGRIPDTDKMPVILQRGEYSPQFVNLLAQVTHKYKNWDFYLGGENLTNFTQKDPITEYFAPYHTHFDTSMVWGPIVGASIYAGIRYSLKDK